MAYDAFMTPPSELAIAREYLGGITVDPASSIIAAPYVQAKYFAISPEEFAQCMYKQYENVSGSILNVDGLDKAWHGTVWLNPPYSKGLIDAYVDKAIHEWNDVNRPGDKLVERMLILVNSQTDTNWYHTLAKNATRIFHYRGRLKFWKMQNGKAWEKWEGEESIKRRTLDPTKKAKVGNSPRYLNTLFLFEADMSRLDLFRRLYGHRGIISIPEV
jgi:hypothetical protein